MRELHPELSATDERNLHAFADGELNPLVRWWFERRIARSPALSAELAEIRKIGRLLEDVDQIGPGVDLWDSIAMRLPAIDAERAEAGSSAGSLGSWIRQLNPGIAVAATAAVALAVVLGTIPDADIPTSTAQSVRWLDTGGRSVMVMEDAGDLTIVWLLESPAEGAPSGELRDAV